MIPSSYVSNKLILKAFLIISLISFTGYIITSTPRVAASNSFKIKQRRPVVNEGQRIKLTAVNNNGQSIETVTWSSGSPDIAEVNRNTGEVFGVKQGFATITANNGGETNSVFVVVAKVRKGSGAAVPGDTKLDTNGNLYISNPIQNIILRADDALTSPTEIFAGRPQIAGMRDGERQNALFAGPTAISVDNGPRGGIYITDTLNHSVRKISFNNQVETLLGSGTPGLPSFSAARLAGFERISLNGPRGIAADAGGNIFLADTDNHAIYYLDFTRRQASLIAGEPGTSGTNDGTGRSARFNRPSGLALSNDKRLLAVADSDNNRVRLIDIQRDTNNELIGSVSTIGAAPSQLIGDDGDSFIFDSPISVSFDGAGNIYVVDKSGVNVILRPPNRPPQIVSLAQPEISFNQAVSVFVRGTEIIVLDSQANSAAEAIKVITVGGPEINDVTPNVLSLTGNAEVTVQGKNFAPETQVIFAGQLVSDLQVVRATELRFRIGPQFVPGSRTLSILTRGGLAQQELTVASKSLDQLAVGEITTLFGGAIFTGNGGSALKAPISANFKVVLDGQGNLYLVSARSGVLRRIDAATGIITAIAGGGTSSAENIPASTARIEPSCVALDQSGNIFIGDEETFTIRRIDVVTGNISTVIGNRNKRSFDGDGGPAIDAGLGGPPREIVIDSKGNIFVQAALRVRRIDAVTGIITTFVGTGEIGPFRDNIPATQAQLADPLALALDNDDNLHIADNIQRHIYRIDNASGRIVNVAGKDGAVPPNNEGAYNGMSPTETSYLSLRAITFDANNNLIFQESNFLLRINVNSGKLELIDINPADEASKFARPNGVVLVDGVGNILFSTSASIHRINPQSGSTTIIAGGQPFNLRGDNGPAIQASLGDIFNFTMDQSENIFISDSRNFLVRKIDSSTGLINTLVNKDTVKNLKKRGDSRSFLPGPLTVSSKNELFFGDGDGFIFQMNQSNNQLKRFAGKGGTKVTGDGGPATQAELFPFDILVDNKNNLYIAGKGRIRKIDAQTGIIDTFVADTKAFKSPFGGLGPFSITIDKSNNIYAASFGGFIYRVDPQGKIKLIAGNGSIDQTGDGGQALSAGLGLVRSIAVNDKGELFFAAEEVREDRLLSTSIRRINLQTGIIDTLVRSNATYSGDGGPANQASINGLVKLGFDRAGNLLFISNDLVNFVAIRAIKLAQ